MSDTVFTPDAVHARAYGLDTAAAEDRLGATTRVDRRERERE